MIYIDDKLKLLQEAFNNMEQGPFAVFLVAYNKPEKGICATTRAADRGEKGKIGLPGGKVDPGENPIEAVKRESHEEGWDIENIESNPVHKSIVEGKEIWWFKGSNPTKLSNYKEQHRIKPIVVPLDDIISSGYGNDWLEKLRKDFEYFYQEPEKLLEMPSFNDSNKDIENDLSDNKPKILENMEKRNFVKIDEIKINDLECSFFNNKNMMNVYIFDKENTIGEFNWYRDDGKWKTESASLLPDYQGKGIGFRIYSYVIEKYFHTLYSDSSLTGEYEKGSFQLWIKLGKNLPYKYLYNIQEDMLEEVSGFNQEMMGDENILFVVSIEDIIEEQI